MRSIIVYIAIILCQFRFAGKISELSFGHELSAPAVEGIIANIWRMAGARRGKYTKCTFHHAAGSLLLANSNLLVAWIAKLWHCKYRVLILGYRNLSILGDPILPLCFFFKTLLQEQVPFYLIFSIWKDKRNYNKKKDRLYRSHLVTNNDEITSGQIIKALQRTKEKVEHFRGQCVW